MSRSEPETATVNDGKTTLRRMRVTLLTDRGLQQFILETPENLQFADAALPPGQGRPGVDRHSRAIARARPAPWKLSARGQGKRTGARPRYIVEAPVWKAS